MSIRTCVFALFHAAMGGLKWKGLIIMSCFLASGLAAPILSHLGILEECQVFLSSDPLIAGLCSLFSSSSI